MANDDFINYIWPHALAASEATGVDPRIIAGQAAVESGWGKHFVGNNLFGIKGPGVNALTTEVGPSGAYQTSASFRSYPTPADSVAGYADFINSNPRYASFKQAQDVGGQLNALQRSGYATDPQYAGKVADAASAIDAAVRKKSDSQWSGKPGTPTDIGTALGYTGTPAAEGSKAAPVSDNSDFFKDMGIDPNAKKNAAPAPTEGQGSDFFKDMGITPPEAKSAPAASQGAAKAASPAIPTGDAAAATGQAIFDLPVVGPYIQGGAAKTVAAIRSLQNDTPFSQELANVQDFMQRTKEAHPYATAGGRTLAAGATLAGGAALGAGGVLGMTGNMIPRIAYGTASGAALGGADAYTHGDNPLMGAALGGGGGAIAPVAGQMAGMGINKLVQGAQYLMPTGVSGISRPAANIAATVINADDPAAIQATLAQHGPLAMLADAGPSTNALTAGLALKPGAAKTEVTNALTARAAGRDTRLASDVNAAVGPDPIPSQVESGLKGARQALSPEYTQALAGAKAVNTQPLADNLDASVANLRGPAQKAVKEVRGMLNIPGTDQLDPNPTALLATRNAIDGMMENEANSKVIGNLTEARGAVDAELTKAVPGIKDVDAKFQELARQREALKAGGQALDSGKTASRPSEFAQNFTEGANPQGTLVGPSAVPLRTQQGMAGEVHRLVGTKGNDLVALKSLLQGEGGWNTTKLGTAFGEQPTNQLINAVNREAAFTDTTNKVLQNSATAGRQAAGKLLEETEPGSMNLIPASATGLALQAGKKMILDPLVHLLTASPAAPRNLELARIMTSQGATRDQILQQLLRLNARQQAVSNTGNLLAGITSGSVNPLLAGASATQRP